VTAILAIARNTLSETLRQNVYGLVLALAGLLIVFSPHIAMFTFVDSTKLVLDMGLATILLAGLFLGVLCSATVVNREIEGRTALTVLSKPVSRESFVLGKFLGLALAVTVAVYILGIVLMLTYRFGVKDAVWIELDWGVVAGMSLAVLGALLIGLFQNYFFARPFITVMVWALAATMTLCLIYFAIYDKEYQWSGFGAGLNWQVAVSVLLVLQAVLVLVAVALVASTRVRIVASLTITTAAFLAGLLSKFMYDQILQLGALARWPAEALYAVLPNLQLYWVQEAMAERGPRPWEHEFKQIPWEYVGSTALYTVLYLAAVLALGMVLFARREVRE